MRPDRSFKPVKPGDPILASEESQMRGLLAQMASLLGIDGVAAGRFLGFRKPLRFEGLVVVKIVDAHEEITSRRRWRYTVQPLEKLETEPEVWVNHRSLLSSDYGYNGFELASATATPDLAPLQADLVAPALRVQTVDGDGIGVTEYWVCVPNQWYGTSGDTYYHDGDRIVRLAAPAVNSFLGFDHDADGDLGFVGSHTPKWVGVTKCVTPPTTTAT